MSTEAVPASFGDAEGRTIGHADGATDLAARLYRVPGCRMTRILAIDPGPTCSGWVDYGAAPTLCAFGITTNAEVLAMLRGGFTVPTAIVIEKVASYGMAVGAEVFETVYWSGRFAEAVGGFANRITRKAIVTHLCGSARAKDANVRQALLDRFGGKDAALGRKAAPGPLYGVHGDIWAALAVAVAFSDGVR